MLKTDFLIIGSGISGLTLALYLAKQGKVLIVTKKKIRDSNTFYAQGGIAAVTDKKDSFSSHFKDTLIAGHFHNNKNAVKILVRSAPNAIRFLKKLGMNFKKNKTLEGGHSFNRILNTLDRTGKEIEETLIRNVKKNRNIGIKENCFAKDLLMHKKTCFGCFSVFKNKGLNILADAVIIATGGIGQIYERTTNPETATGDGIAMAFRAGVKLKDMEFIQFHPSCFIRKNKGRHFMISESVRGEGAYLRNEKNKRFMLKFHPMAELAPRDIVTIAGIKQKKVFLDFRHKNKKYIKNRFPYIWKELKKYKFDLSKNLIPIIPVAHYLCGGIKTDLNGNTSIKGLYALGEASCTGVHGANRLASNSLIEAVVFAKRIFKKLRQQKIKNLKQYVLILPEEKQIKVKRDPQTRKRIQQIMWKYAGIIRSRNGLHKAYDMLEKTSVSPFDLECKNMLDTAKSIVKAAIKRKKCMGTHYLDKK